MMVESGGGANVLYIWPNLVLFHQGHQTLSLSALATSELQNYLQEIYTDDVHACYFCKILTVRVRYRSDCDSVISVCKYCISVVIRI